MSAWIDIVKHSTTTSDTHFSWKEYLHTSIKTVAVSLIAMALSTFVMVVMEYRWQSSPISAGRMGMWELCLAFAGSGVAVTGADWFFGASERKSNL